MSPPKKNFQNEFHKELMRVLRTFEMLDCWKRLSKETQAEFTSRVVRPMRLVKDPGSGIETRVITALKNDIKQIIDSWQIKLEKHNSTLAFHDLLTAGLTIKSTIEAVIDETNIDFDKWAYLHGTLDRLISSDKAEPFEKLSAIKDNMCYICTSIDRAYYWIDRVFHAPTRLENYVCLIYILKKSLAEKKHVLIDGKSRPVFRLGLPVRKKGPCWASASLGLIEADGETNVEMPVYVQSHALQRLRERLTPLEKPIIQVLLYVAFENPVFSRGPDGARFVAFRYHGAKIGYLLYEIIDAMVVVKTFLLISQNGTFEGNALNKEYNLSKYSKTYFDLDKLYTYVNTDVYEDRELKALFTKCGCGDLFNVWDEKEKDAISFDKNYAKNLKKIFLNEAAVTA
jgi:hypothetical protein